MAEALLEMEGLTKRFGGVVAADGISLMLPSGELHEFLCSQCASSLGKRTVTGPAVAPPTRRPQPPRTGRKLLR